MGTKLNACILLAHTARNIDFVKAKIVMLVILSKSIETFHFFKSIKQEQRADEKSASVFEGK